MFLFHYQQVLVNLFYIYRLLPGTFDQIRIRGHSVALVVSLLIALNY